ncbi:hypothetical protein SKAU_G00065520 [Synaphobranchus kaupii]|uniref:Uncharacterized protein n=1 Tax=Synaphobranchus kaupii TaxID=118154 RepID=A0A9Q1G6T6_SYNKA|nr:hypothetical protein SKAU_G00065520 [Synaphobranchus kaupii]
MPVTFAFAVSLRITTCSSFGPEACWVNKGRLNLPRMCFGAARWRKNQGLWYISQHPFGLEAEGRIYGLSGSLPAAPHLRGNERAEMEPRRQTHSLLQLQTGLDKLNRASCEFFCPSNDTLRSAPVLLPAESLIPTSQGHQCGVSRLMVRDEGHKSLRLLAAPHALGRKPDLLLTYVRAPKTPLFRLYGGTGKSPGVRQPGTISNLHSPLFGLEAVYN